MFIDQAEIYVTSGRGGDGVVHFRREKYVPRGGPDGGDGGKGGDVVFEVLPTLNTLYAFRHKTRFRAQDGGRGAKQNMTGRSGEDLLIHVPPGTIVFDASSGEALGDLLEPGQRLVVARGGRGGRGNARFATAVHQVPRVAERGEPGEQRNLRLELRLIADIGIVGVPNAGKSTLLAAVTNARPKIAPYPFTTLEPNLGVAELDDETSLVLADIPGLIEGAHMGVGLGHDFLRHIQRTRVLIHLLDGMSEDPLLDFAQINSELALFDPNLARKPQIVAFNKMDLTDVQERWPQLQADLKKWIKRQKGELNIDAEPLAISAVAGTQVRELLYRASQLLGAAPPLAEISELPIYRPEEDPREFSVAQTSQGWRVSGKAIERAAEMTYWEHEQSVRRFQRILETLGVEKALREAGVQEGDTVFIGDYELEWQD
ncbi:MAG: GTPase ObgE [Anaerolineales bacterium]|nr:GTPase ObgE [Anaerolineales bacterium]